MSYCWSHVCGAHWVELWLSINHSGSLVQMENSHSSRLICSVFHPRLGSCCSHCRNSCFANRSWIQQRWFTFLSYLLLCLKCWEIIHVFRPPRFLLSSYQGCSIVHCFFYKVRHSCRSVAASSVFTSRRSPETCSPLPVFQPYLHAFNVRSKKKKKNGLPTVQSPLSRSSVMKCDQTPAVILPFDGRRVMQNLHLGSCAQPESFLFDQCSCR